MISEEQITCMICSNIFVNPVSCPSCKNSFCKGCYLDLVDFNKKKNKNVQCPLCKKEINNVEENIEIEKLLKNMLLLCKKCNLTFNSYDEYVKHNDFCKKLICKICNSEFKNILLFNQHFENNELHLDIVSYLFDKNNDNNNDNWSLIFANDIAKLNNNNNSNLNINKYKNNEFVNFLDIKEESNFVSAFNQYNQSKKPFREFSQTNSFLSNCEKSGDTFINKKNQELKDLNNIPPKSKYYKKYDLFYCFEKTNIDCQCCPEHICKPGSCLCKDCMKINLKYHGLKSYFCINKEKRACKYSNKFFRCHFKYLKISVTENGNNIVNESFCHGFFPACPACQETTKLMEYYIKNETIEKLKSFD